MQWFFVPALLTAAHLLWISLDTGAFGGDQSVYGFATLELFNSLIHSPREWPHLMMHVFPWKANGLIWAGQFFLPFAYLTSSVDKALLLTIWTMQLITLIMIYRALSDLETDETVPILGCLVVASAPLFVSLGQHYMVETSTTLSVAWFIVLMCMAPKMTRPQILAHLIAASSFALLTKVSQPLFCVWPGVVACRYFVWPRRTDANSLGSPYTLFSFTIAILLSAATVAWYVRNMTPVMQLAREGASRTERLNLLGQGGHLCEHGGLLAERRTHEPVCFPVRHSRVGRRCVGGSSSSPTSSHAVTTLFFVRRRRRSSNCHGCVCVLPEPLQAGPLLLPGFCLCVRTWSAGLSSKSGTCR